MRFSDLACLLEHLASTTKRTEMVELCSDFLCRVSAPELEPAIRMLLGQPFLPHSAVKLNVSWATVRDVVLRVSGASEGELFRAFRESGDLGEAVRQVFETHKRKQRPLVEHPMDITGVFQILVKVAEAKGPKARERKERLLEGLFARATPLEAKYLTKVIVGEMRTGFREGMVEQAIARAFAVPEDLVRRARTFIGDIARVALIASQEGVQGLQKVRPELFTPVGFMLAQTARSIKECLEIHGGRTALEFKFDGARVQIHKRDTAVRIFSRRMADVTSSMPDIAQLVQQELSATEAIVEGEVIAVDSAGRPRPFQILLHRFRRERGIEALVKEIPLQLYLFDLLYLNGEPLVDSPYHERRQKLAEIAGSIPLSPQLVVSDSAEGERFLNQAIQLGHEGLVAKKLDAPYTAGVRGKNWLKVKPTMETLDLVIVGAEYGYGRRHRWLSDYYLAALDAETGKFEIVGKTFKGLTDEEIQWMTKRLQELKISEEGRRIWVKPEVVVEVAYNEIQRSPKYPCGMVLRFARITKIREDKSSAEADTLQRVRELFNLQVKKF